MTPNPLPTSAARVGVVAGWWAPDGAARTSDPAHRMARSSFTGRRGKKTLCGLVITQAHQVSDGSTVRDACPDCSTAAARIPGLNDPTREQRLPPPSPPRPAALSGAPQDNTAAARTARRRAFRESWMTSERARDYVAAAYDPPPPALLAATALPRP